MWPYFSRLLYTSVIVVTLSTNSSSAFCQSEYDWIYVSGDTTTELPPSYPSAIGKTGSPGGRWMAGTWVDQAGDLWLFGGRGHSVQSIVRYSDMWKFDVSESRWYWMGGSFFFNDSSVYPLSVGEVGQPGSRESPATWIDDNGHFWMFGGNGSGVTPGTVGPLNDMWKYNPTTNIWTWQGGSKVINDPGDYSAGHGMAGLPAARFDSAFGKTEGGAFLLFGGTSGAVRRNDLWRFSPASGIWTWLDGSSSPEAPGQYPAQIGLAGLPGARTSSAFWTDNNGYLWIFGGMGVYTGTTNARLADLWRYEPANNLFYYMGGTFQQTTYPPNLNEVGTLGGRNNAMAWTAADKFWLSGGFGSGAGNQGRFNDLWAYDPLEGNWRHLDGPKGETQGEYPAAAGEKGLPQGRMGGLTWTSGNRMYLYGGADGAKAYADMWYYPAISQSNVDDWQLWDQ